MDHGGSVMIHAIKFPPIASGRKITFETAYYISADKAKALQACSENSLLIPLQDI